MSEKIQILVIEDSQDDYELLIHKIRKELDVQSSLRIETSAELHECLTKPWDIVISDNNLPNFSAMAALQIMREKSKETPFIIVSGTLGEDLAVQALKAGADDYIMKDNLTRLLPAIKREIQEHRSKIKQKQIEQELSQTQKFYGLLANNIHDLVVLHKPDSTYLWVSPSVEKMLGYSQNELIGKMHFDFIHPDDYNESFNNPFAQNESIRKFNYRLKTKKGSFIYVESILQPILSEGKLAQIVTTTRDVTEQKLAFDLLVESEERYHGVVNSLTEGVILYDENGEVLTSNKQGDKMMAVVSTDLKNFEKSRRTDIEFIKSDYSPFSREDHPSRITLKTGKALTNVEIGLRRKGTDEITWLSVNSSPFELPDKKRGAIVSFSDITQRVQANKKWREAQSQYRMVIESLAEGVLLLDEDRNVVAVNKSAKALFDLTSFDAVDRNISFVSDRYIVVDSEEKPLDENKRPSRSVFNTHKPVFNQIIGLKERTDENKILWLSCNALPLEQNHGKNQIVISFSDITERKLNRDKLENLVDELTSLIDHANAPIFGIDWDGRINEWNQVCSTITGYKKSEVIGKGLINEFILDGYKVAVTDLLKGAMRGKGVTNYELPIYTRDGRVVTILFNATPRKNHDGKITGVLGVGQDITELIEYRSKLEQKVAERTRKLNEALEHEKELVSLKSKFVSMASHEFRTPLATISFATDFLQRYHDRITWADTKKKLQKIEEQVKHMTHLLEDVLVMGKSEAGKIKMTPTSVDLKGFCNTLIEEVQHSTNQTHQIMLSVASQHDEVIIDEKLLRNILINLLTNAIKFSPHKSKVLCDVICRESEIVLIVKDWGMGIPEKEQQKVFEPFHRASSAGAIQGTGLGLAIVKKALEIQKGTIELESTPGEGTIFKVTIPLQA